MKRPRQIELASTGHLLRGHIAIIMKRSPHYVLTNSTISDPWHSFDPRPSPNFSPQLRDKIWEWPGDKATLGPPLCVHNMEVSVFWRLPGGVVICNRAGKPNMAPFLDLSIDLQCCERLARWTTSVTSLRMRVCIYACLDRPLTENFK